MHRRYSPSASRDGVGRASAGRSIASSRRGWHPGGRLPEHHTTLQSRGSIVGHV